MKQAASDDDSEIENEEAAKKCEGDGTARRRKPADIIFRDGFAYITQKISGDPPTRYLKCKMRQITNCPATGKVPIGGSTGDFVPIQDTHNHDANDDLKLKNDFMALLKAMCSSHKTTTVRNIYRAAAKIDPEGAHQVSFETVHTSMRKWQKNQNESASSSQILVIDEPEESTPAKRGKYNPRRPPDVIFKDGFAYINQKISGDPPVRYLKCSMRNSINCSATGKVPVGGTSDDFVPIQAEHNHPPNREAEIKTEFKGLLKRMSLSQISTARNIYLAAELLDPEGARLVPFKSVQSSMWKWQREAPTT